ncbi:hypothetical protein CX649_04730 [Bacillaceae bacterium ZC4]|jgi:mannosyl-glycoprotein endo-beta-N-acetylglucosaminidase|uniref:N-acetylglucosaminidase n=1 Tax=Aeribacillus sp. FSL K6-1305 TaxID=2954569 RepID=UPI00118B4707|nr:hypothetical protein CX649_04730 [Bacillaceae bacterium ZC4]MDR9791488.1 N-acetylglucosaminidase [Aeribacillus pallidus]
MYKRLGALFCSLIILLSVLPINIGKAVTTEFYRVSITSEKAPVYSLDDEKIVGYLYGGFEFYSNKIVDDKIIFNMNNKQFYIKLESVNYQLEENENVSTVPENLDLPQYKVLTDQTPVFLTESSGKQVGILSNGFIIQPIQENDTQVIFSIGNQLVQISKNNLEILANNVESPQINEKENLNSGESSDIQKEITSDVQINSENNQQTAIQNSNENLQVENNPIMEKKLLMNSNSHKFFKVKYDNTPVYQNNKIITYLKKDQEYQRVADSGNWYKVKIGSGYGYVWKEATLPSTGSTIQNLNKLKISNNYIITLDNTIVYDTSSGKRVPFAEISANTKYPIIGGYNKYANWYEVDILGRIGYIMKTSARVDFSNDMEYFRVKYGGTPIFVNHENGSQEVVHLYQGQVFKRVSDYGNWHMVKVADGYGYVWEAATEPADDSSIKNKNNGLKISENKFKALDDLVVYDTSSGKRVPFATIKKGAIYPILGDYKKYANWYQVDIDGRIGFVNKSNTELQFSNSTKYFEVIADNLPVYAPGTSNVFVYLKKGEKFERVQDSGNWHLVKVGDKYGYVWKQSTKPTTSTNITNLNNGQVSNSRAFKALQDVKVIDTSTSSRKTFAVLNKGVVYPVIQEYENWYKVDVMGRIGYVNKSGTQRTFANSDRYFQVIRDNVYAVSSNGTEIIKLSKNEIYPRVKDDGNWHKVKINNEYAYVWKDSTQSIMNPNVKDLNSVYKIPNRKFTTNNTTQIFDSNRNVIGELKGNQAYNFIDIVGRWFKVDVLGRIGYVYMPATSSILSYYDMSLDEMLNIQMRVSPQTQIVNHGYVHENYIHLMNNGNTGIVIANALNVRTTPSINGQSNSCGQLQKGDTIEIIGKVGEWYKIKYSKSCGGWKDADREDVLYFLNPDNFLNYNGSEIFQFLKLSQYTGLTADEINNKILKGKGILEGKGQAFVTAAQKYNINEIYLVAHALHETGNGTSRLANGVQINGKTVYNMYGIGAKDSCPITCGAEYAFQKGWTDPEKAIIGGAAFIGEGYIHNGQDTLYKMRWNPDNPGTHQYATDIRWAILQANSYIGKYYSLLDKYILYLDIPVFK